MVEMDFRSVTAEIDAELRQRGTTERAVQEKAYLHSALEHYGTTVPAIRAVVKSVSTRYPVLGHDDLLALVDALWSAPVHERRMAAVELLEFHVARLQPGDMPALERLLREARTWALVDGLAASVVGPLVERHPALASVLDRWVVDDDFWLRRSALLALLLALRRGAGDFQLFSRYADPMLQEKEFFIRKAIGWVLRDTARRRPAMVYEWLLPRAARASGLGAAVVLWYAGSVARAAVRGAR